MPEYDGSIVIDTHIDTDNFDKDASKLFNKSKEVADSISSSFSNLKNVDLSKAIDIKNVSSKISEIPKEINKIDVSSVSSAISQLPKELQNVEMKIFNISNAITYLRDNAENLLGDFGGEVFNQLDLLQNKLVKLRLQKEILQSTPTISASDLSDARQAAGSLDEVANKTAKVSQEAKKTSVSFKDVAYSVGNRLSNAAKSSSSKMVSYFRNASSTIQGLFSPLSNIFSKILHRAKFILMGQLIRKVFQDVRQSFADLKEFGGPFAQSAQEITDAYKRATNAIATAFAPALQALAPIIVRISNAIVDLMNKITLFTTALFTNSKTAVISNTNFSGYSKSLNKSTKAAKKNAKATKEQADALAKFDKLDVYKQPKSNDSGVGAETPSQVFDMFKTVEIPNDVLSFKDKLLKAFDEIKKRLKPIREEFMKGFNLGFKEKNLDKVKDKLINIGRLFKEIFTDDNVVNKFNKAILALSFNLGKVVGAASSIGVSMAKLLIGGFEKFLDSNKERIKKSIIRNLDTTIDFSNLIGRNAEFAADIGTVFSSESAQSAFGNFLSVSYNLFDMTFSNIYKLIVKVAQTISDPFTKNVDGIKTALEGVFKYSDGVFGGLNSVFEGLNDTVTDLVDNALSPLSDILNEILTSRVKVLISAWNQNVKPVMEEIGAKTAEIGKKIGEAYRKLAKPIISISKLIVAVYNKIKPFLEKYFYPLIQWFANSVAGTIALKFQLAFSIVEAYFTTVTKIFGDFADDISYVIDTVTDLINGDWNDTWDNALEVMKSFARGVLSALKSIPDMFVEAINDVIEIINDAIWGLNQIGFGDFKVNIPMIPKIPRIPMNFGIPGLSAGTVVSPNKEFLALLGDNTHEPEVVSPISTMKRAFVEAIGESNIAGNGNVTLQIDGKTFARLINPYIDSEKNRVGISMVQGVY